MTSEQTNNTLILRQANKRFSYSPLAEKIGETFCP